MPLQNGWRQFPVQVNPDPNTSALPDISKEYLMLIRSSNCLRIENNQLKFK